MSESSCRYIGIDVGTSGVRGICISNTQDVSSESQVAFSEVNESRNSPIAWKLAVTRILRDILAKENANSVRAIAVDGTSGTMIAVDKQGAPVSRAKMYNDVCTKQEIIDRISEKAPSNSAVHGASSGLAKAIQLSGEPNAYMINFEADWLTSELSGRVGIADENNALKTGYDAVNSRWPDWIEDAGMAASMLPRVMRAGTPIGPAVGKLARSVGLSEDTLVVAGTTDGCASFLATGANEPGDGVSVLGSTLTIKLLSDAPLFAPQYGIYSHRIGNAWLAGGASNTGGAVLAHYFNSSELEELSACIDLSGKSELDYYPLIKKGERFPINDSSLAPKLTPRPDSDVLFLHGILQGIAAIEKLGYQRLMELGAPQLKTLRTVGGGAQNTVWSQIRSELLGVEFKKSVSVEAALGAAILAKQGAEMAREYAV